jgi:hypothetical protein
VEEHIVLSRKFIKQQPGRRWLTYAAGLSLLALTFGIAGSALAVHDLVFQLDGDTSTARGTTPSAAQTKDWDSLFNADGSKIASAFSESATVNAFTAGVFVRDFGVKVNNTDDKCSLTNTTSTTFCTADTTTFATGSKDSLDITPGWQCNKDNNVNSKIDIMNAYAAQYLDAAGHRIMYFGLDKNKDNGNNNVAFWFIRGSATCVAPSGSVAFSGTHQNGDVLVVSAFTNGGGVSNITAYMWNNGCIDNPSPQTPNACDGLAIGNGGDCKALATGPDSICATTNSGPFAFNTNITTQWLTSDATLGVGTTVVPPDFFEGGVDLTAVFGQVGQTVPSCFNTFIADTRSSQSLTATLFDYARGQLGNCVSNVQTAQKWRPNDEATITVTGTQTWGGSVAFTLYEDSLDCNVNDPGTVVYSTTDSVSNTDPTAATNNTTEFIATATHTYSWLAVFTPNQASSDAGVQPGRHCETTDLEITN